MPRVLTFVIALLAGAVASSCSTAPETGAADQSPARTDTVAEPAASTGSSTTVESNVLTSVDVDPATALDSLATDLSEITTVYRTHESITVRLPDEKFFGPRLQELTAEGGLMLGNIADVLLRYPDTRIYIQTNVAEHASDRSEAMEEALLIQVALRDRGIDINRLEVDVTTPAEPRKAVEVGDEKLEPKQYFELDIIPRV